MKTLSLFNAVVAKPSKTDKHFISEKGFIVEPNALWAKDRIISYYKQCKLDGKDLNKTFHKSWEKVRNSSRYELLLEQIHHYISTYGSNFQDEIYIPSEILNIPNTKVVFKVIKAFSSKEMTDRCLNMLCSGIALNEDTINDLLSVLVDELKYSFTGQEGIKNKEAVIKIADLYGVLPTDTMEFFRYSIYRATGESLLIKNTKTIDQIKKSNYNPAIHFQQHGLDKLATIFNRFKPLFLAFKHKCPAVINKISKLSKTHHVPLVQNSLNLATQRLLTTRDKSWCDNATPFALFKAMTAIHSRLHGQDTFCYRIRNGKSFVKQNNNCELPILAKNYIFLTDYLRQRFDLSNIKIFLPKDVEYAVPTSEKMFVGYIPTGTKFYGNKLVVGIYWEDEWGAMDLDLSAISISGDKIGWNRAYSNKNLTYSGDITSAPNGAVEYLHAHQGLDQPYLVQNNVYCGQDNSGYKIIVGKGSKVSKSYIMNPNKVMLDVKTETPQRQTIVGLFLPELSNKQSFVLLNVGAGRLRISYGKSLGCSALYQQYKNPFNFTELLNLLQTRIVDNLEDADYDFSLKELNKDSFTNLFNN